MTGDAYDLHDRRFSSYQGKWRYRVTGRRPDGSRIVRALFKRRYDAAAFCQHASLNGIDAALRHMNARGNRPGIDFKDDL